MNSCPSATPYTFNIQLNDNTKFNYRINPGTSVAGDQKHLLTSKLLELNWINPYDQNESFIEGEDMSLDDQCFTNSSDTLTFNNCYINRSCAAPTGKVVDYHCNQSIPYTPSSLVFGISSPVPTPTFMPNIMDPAPDFASSTRGWVRCKEGYVFKQSQHTMDNETEYATAQWVKDNTETKIWWLRPDSTSNSPIQNELTGECVPDKCKEVTIPDSSYSYDPLVGGHIDHPITVKCNDGYIFNHDLLHQGGKVKCDYDLKQRNDNLWEPNTMSWYIHDDRLDSLCNAFSSEDECKGVNGYPTPTYDPYQFIDTVTIDRKNGLYNLEVDTLHGADGVAIGCQWSPATQDNTYSNASKPAQCSFRKKVDHEDMQDPLCHPVSCPEKIVPHSNRSGLGVYHPLPGPRNEARGRGECLTTDGTIINVSNVEDCLCQKHMSCNSCSSDDNCQWCGSKSSDPNIVPGCYYKDTNEPICNVNPVRQGEGGSCLGTNGREYPNWGNLPIDQRNISTCERDFECHNENLGDAVPSIDTGNTDLSIEAIQRNYQINTGRQPPVGRDLCLSYNNSWSDTTTSSGTSNDTSCFFKKNNVLRSSTYREDGQSPYFGLWEHDGAYNLAISPYYCRPNNSGGVSGAGAGAAAANCPTHQTYETCAGDLSCSWESNPLSDSIINWNIKDTNKYGDIVRLTNFQSNDCYICNNDTIRGEDDTISSCTPLPSLPDSDKYLVVHRDGNDYNYVNLHKLDRSLLTIDPSVQGKCSIQYMDTDKFSINNAYNISRVLTQQVNGDYKMPIEAINCIKPEGGGWTSAEADGFRYCDPSGASDCGSDGPLRTSANIDGNDYCPIRTNCDRDTKKCKRSNKVADDLITTQIDDSLSTIYNKKEFYSLSGKNLRSGDRAFQESYCSSTFNSSENPFRGDGIYADKKFAKCNLVNGGSGHRYNKSTCELLNKKEGSSDTVHWGKFCISHTDNTKVPMKHVCENLKDSGGDFEWKEELDRTNNMWMGKCYNVANPTIPDPLDDIELCNLASPSSHYRPDSNNECIITVSSTKDDNLVRQICENWEVPDMISDNKFEFHIKPLDVLSSHNSGRSGTCIIGSGRDLSNTDNLDRETRQICEHDNNTYIKEYTYSNSSFCDTSDVNFQIDRNLRWTGGELRSEGTDWLSECGSSMLSSCQVNCDDLYGGGGTYTCHYNTHSEDVCQHVQDTFSAINDGDIQKTNCEHHSNCVYHRGNPLSISTCHSIATPGDDLIKGQAEWMGKSCYLLNNDAFSHGIYNLSSIDDYLPPLIRLFIFFIIVIIFAMLIRKAKIYSGIANIIKKLLGGGTKRIMTGSTKIIYDLYRAIINISLKGIKISFNTITLKHFKKLVVLAICIVGFLIYRFFNPDFLEDITVGYTIDDISSTVKDKTTNIEHYFPKKVRPYVSLFKLLTVIILIIIVRYFVGRNNTVEQKVRQGQY